MSLILDALNRSRRDADAVPGLETEHPTEPVSSGALPYLPWVGLVLALVLIGWLLLERDEEPDAAATTPVAELSRNVGSAMQSVKAELEARAAAAQSARPVGESGDAAANSAGPALPVAAREQEIPAPVAAAPGPEAPAPAAPGTTTQAQAGESPEGQDSAEVEQLYQRQAVAPERPAAGASTESATPRNASGTDEQGEGRREEPVDIERLLMQAREEVENDQLVDHPAPFLAELSQQTKDDIPTIIYARHEYSGGGGNASVVMNRKTLRIGGSPAPGVKIDEILPDSSVLSYKGTQFRLRALNSWVNL